MTRNVHSYQILSKSAEINRGYVTVGQIGFKPLPLKQSYIIQNYNSQCRPTYHEQFN